MTAITGAAPASAPRPLFTEGYRRVVLSMLLAAYTFNFIDRTIIATIGQAIKVDLKISDLQLGYLGGLYFALLYTLLGVPIARLAERFSRTWIITVSLIVWSGFTALCGAAQSFTQLALCRFGVGIGEAGCSPPSHALISDYFEPKRRASALAIYALGIPLGAMIGAVSGGWLAQNLSWRVAFVVVGLPGLGLALLFKLLVKEPPRGHADLEEHPVLPEDVSPPTTDAIALPPFSLRREAVEMAAVTGRLFLTWPVLNMVLGLTIASFAGYGIGQFAPPFFARAYGLGLAQVGLVVGLVGGFSAGSGTLVGGFLTDWAARRSPVWYALVPAAGLIICAPIYWAAYSQPGWQAAALILLVPGVFHYTYLGPTFGVVQNAVAPARRATAVAVMFLFVNLIALGFGPPFTGWLIDRFAGFHFAHPGAPGLDTAFRSLFSGAGPSFQLSCPGGKAPEGAGAEVAAHCRQTLALATRQGIKLSILFYAWGGLHYLLAAIGMKKLFRGPESA